jgi:hypothetical protein
MPFMRLTSRASWAIAVLLAGSVAAQPARANAAPPSGPQIRPPGDVVVGESVELAWSAPPRGARELEVLLSVDDGAHFTLRATAEIEGALGHARWRVPALPTAHARLRLRWSDGAAETLAPVSPAFRILAVPARAAAPATAATEPTAATAATAWDEADPASAGPLGAQLPGLAPDGTLQGGGDGAGPDFTTPRAPSACMVEPRLDLGMDVDSGPPAGRTIAPVAPLQRRVPLRE